MSMSLSYKKKSVSSSRIWRIVKKKSITWPLLRKETDALVKMLRYSFCEKMKQAVKINLNRYVILVVNNIHLLMNGYR